jgi:hypothetical protein
MNKVFIRSQDENTLAAVAHGSILLGIFNGGVGDVLASLRIWLEPQEESGA